MCIGGTNAGYGAPRATQRHLIGNGILLGIHRALDPPAKRRRGEALIMIDAIEQIEHAVDMHDDS